MNLFKLTRIELKRLAVSRLAWLLALAVLLTPLPGLNSLFFCSTISSNTMLILSPAKLSALLAGILFAVFSIYELDRMSRYRMESIIESGVDVLTMNAAKITAILVFAFLILIAGIVFYLPYTIYRLKEIFDLPLYLASYGLITLPAVIFSVLISSGIYLILCRMDAGFLIFGGLVFYSMNSESNYLLPWLQTNISGYSDYFGNSFPVRLLVWNRLFWFCVSLSVLLAGLLSSRRYEKGVFASLRFNWVRGILPTGLLVFVLAAYFFYIYEPYFDNTPYPEIQEIVDKESNTVLSVIIAEKPDPNEQIRLLDTRANIDLYPEKARLNSRVIFSLENLSAVEQIVRFELQPGYEISSIRANDKQLNWIIPEEGWVEVRLPADKKINLEVFYEGKIQNNRLFQRYYSGTTVISPEYVNLMGKSLLPVLNVDTSANLISGQISAPASLVVLSTGVTQQVSENPEKQRNIWEFTCTWDRLQIIAADFAVEHIQAGGVDIEFYYARQQAEKMQEMKAAELIKHSVDYFTETIGPLDYVDVPLKIVENIISMQGGNAIGNISNVGESIFNENLFRIDNSEGANNIEVLVHEIAHQWWGISTYFKLEPPWSAEGLTVYSTYKFLQHEFGTVYADKTDVERWQDDYEEMKRSFYYRNPEYLDVIPLTYQYFVVSDFNATVLYNQMPLEILQAEEILGEEQFQSVLKKIFRRYKNELTLENFLDECRLTREMISNE